MSTSVPSSNTSFRPRSHNTGIEFCQQKIIMVWTVHTILAEYHSFLLLCSHNTGAMSASSSVRFSYLKFSKLPVDHFYRMPQRCLISPPKCIFPIPNISWHSKMPPIKKTKTDDQWNGKIKKKLPALTSHLNQPHCYPLHPIHYESLNTPIYPLHFDPLGTTGSDSQRQSFDQS